MMTRELESLVGDKPVLWVGAGLSVAAGYPSTDAIVTALRAKAPVDLPVGEFTEVVDAFVDAMSPGDLGDLLERLFQTPHAPTATHRALVRLAAAGRFTALITTNYDDLLERALATEGVKVVVQTCERNAPVREQDGALRLLKLHGSRTDWKNAILSGRAYAAFEARYGFLRAQLDVLLQQHPLLFVGCSLQDPRVLQWLESRPDAWTGQLKRWRAVMCPSDWTAALEMPWRDGKAGSVLSRAPLKRIAIDRHEDLPALCLEVAKKLAPLAVRELVFEVDPGVDQWRSIGPTPEFEPHLAPNPLRTDDFLRDLHRLRALLRRPVFIGDPQSATQLAELRHVARRVGSRLTDTLLSADARTAVRTRLTEVDRGTARLTLRIAEGPRADAALALPWELLMPEDGRFAVDEAKLDLVRDAIKPGAPELDVPSTPLVVAATIAAPDDQVALRYEDEAYRMLKALASLGQVAHFAELGEVDDLVELVRRTQATAVHFSGHGLPGELVFEDELGLSKRVRVIDLMRRLRQRVQQSGVSRTFPRLFFLASCYGASSTTMPIGTPEPDSRTVRAEIETALGEGPSTAATLHREGFACVIGYFGPIGDSVSTSAEVALYTSLSEGGTILHAVKQARGALVGKHDHEGQRYHYPFGWAQLAVYLRGADRPLTARPQSSDWAAPAAVRLERQTIEVSGLPVLEHGFIGRRALQHEVRRKFKAGQRLFVLQGLGGLGKTALASQLLCQVFAQDPRDQLILRLQDASDVALLRNQAETHGDTHAFSGWQDRVKTLNERFPDPVEGFRQTVLALRRHRGALVLYADNMETLQVGPNGTADAQPGALGSWKPEAGRWWTAMESLARDGIVLASTRYAWTGLSREALVPLDRMGRADVWRMLETFPTLAQLPWCDREKIADAADGRPRTLELLDGLLRKADSDPTSTIVDTWRKWVEPVLQAHGEKLTEDLLLAQVWRCVTQVARDHAIAGSVLHSPAPRQVIDALGGATGELVSAGLLTRHRELIVNWTGDALPLTWQDRWSMHASVKMFARAWGDLETLRTARRAAANAYSALVATPGAVQADWLAAIDLFLEVGDGPAAWPLACEYVKGLRSLGQYRGALLMLDRFTGIGLQGDAQLECTLYIAQFRAMAGIRAETTESDVRRGIDAAGTPEGRRAALSELGTMLANQGKYAEGERLLRDSLALYEDGLGREHPDYAAVQVYLAASLLAQEKYTDSEQFLRRSLAVYEKSLTREHPDCLVTQQILAIVLTKQGKYNEAEMLVRNSLGAHEKVLGREHPWYGIALHSLAKMLIQQGKQVEVESLLRDSIAILEKTLGREHFQLGFALHSLAAMLSEAGKYTEAESLLRDSIAILAKTLGLENADHCSQGESLPRGILTLVDSAFGSLYPAYEKSLQLLVNLLMLQGKLGDMEWLLRDSLVLVEKARGSEHPEYVARLQMLADTLLTQGKFAEAERLLRDFLIIAEKALGREHPNYATYLGQLGNALAMLGKFGQAEELLRDSLVIVEKALGREHSAYSNSLQMLAKVLSQGGKYSEAEMLMRESAALVERTLGRESLVYGVSLHSLAKMLSSKGKYVEAEKMLRESADLIEKNLGREHYFNGVTLNSLAEVLWSQGMCDEAERLLHESLSIKVAALGCEHHECVVSMHLLANVFRSAGKFVQAESLLRDALAIVNKTLGVEHSDYGACLHSLADVLSLQGKHAEARDLLRESLTIVEKTFGREHCHYGASLHLLAGVLSEQGNLDEAERLLRQALAIDEKMLGHEHPDYGTSLHSLAVVLSLQGKHNEAELLLREALVNRMTALGPEHPDYHATLQALNVAVSSQGKYVEAEPLLRDFLAIDEGPDLFRPALRTLAITPNLQGRVQEDLPSRRRRRRR